MNKRDKTALADIEAVWKEYSDKLLWDLKDKFHDKYNADDCQTEDAVKRLVLSYVMRWLLEDIHDLDGDLGVERAFRNIALAIAGRGIGGEDFKEKFPMKQFLDNYP